MGNQNDKTQQMIDDGLIFGRDDKKLPSADDPLVEKLMQFMDECVESDCTQTGPHAHVVMKRPEGLNMSNEELQELMQKKFNDEVKKGMQKRAQAEKRRKLGLGE
jgi:hypothetical protein